MTSRTLVIAVPAYNEAAILHTTMTTLHTWMSTHCPFTWKIVISNNGSTDTTAEIIQTLCTTYPKITAIHQPFRSMSRGIRSVWLQEEADIYLHLDADLSTDLSNITLLWQGIEQGYDIVSGSRYAHFQTTERSMLRTLFSTFLMKLNQWAFATDFKDFQCGFKAINHAIRAHIIPQMRCLNEGFMSTEMIVVSLKKGYRVQELPISWKPDIRATRIRFLPAITDALLNIAKIGLRLKLGHYT